MYATQTDIENRLDPKHLVELADDDSDGAADAAVINAAIADADGQIDACLATRYTLPFATPPALLTKISADLAIEALFARRRESASPTHQARAKVARDILQALASGQILLSEAAAHTLKTAPDSTTREKEKTFSRDSLDDF